MSERPPFQADSGEPRAVFTEVMEYRFACKLYDENAPLTKAETDFILNTGRLSPTSFGLEHWHFYGIVSAGMREKLYRACFLQDGVRTAPFSVVITCLKSGAYDPDGSFVAGRGRRFPGALADYVEDYRGYYEFLRDSDRLDHWARSQTYIACANMMTGAAFAGIESCAIEGFRERDVLDMLGLDGNVWETGIIVTFGHRAEAVREKIREPLDKIATYL